MKPFKAPVTSRRKLKVCHVVASTAGASWVVEQLRELRDKYEHDVAVILNGSEGNLVDRLRAEAIPVYAADFDFTTRPLILIRKATVLASLIRRLKFDVVQTHLFHSMVVGRIAAWMADVPVRLSMIAGPFHLEAYTSRWIDSSTCWMDTSIIPSCEYSRQLYRTLGVSENRLHVIYYGSDEHKFDPAAVPSAGLRQQHGWSADTPLIGMIAYFYPELGKNRWTPPALQGKAIKGHEDLIRAAPIVLREFPKAKFLLVGGGWHEAGNAVLQRVQSLVTEFGLGEHVVFTGVRSDIANIYRDLDVAVQPSLNENLGGTIESLMMQCPTVATRVGGMTDSVVDGETGVLVEPGNPSDLAEGILRILRDPGFAEQVRRAGRARMLSGFTLRKTVADLDLLYQGLSASNGYRRSVALWRGFLGRLVAAWVALRLLIVDNYLLPHWDQGRRPWHVGSWIVLLPVYALVNLLAPGLGLRNKISTMRNVPRMWLYRGYILKLRNATHTVRVMARILVHHPRLRNCLLAMRAMPRMWLYRMYGMLHQVAHDAGLRNGLVAMRTMPRMWLYRMYGMLHQVAHDAGLRNGLVAMRTMPRMWLYRVYGMLHQVAHDAGLRNGLHAMRTMPRMWLYRCYAVVSHVLSRLAPRKKRRKMQDTRPALARSLTDGDEISP